jgi:hypothetical protein
VIARGRDDDLWQGHRVIAPSSSLACWLTMTTATSPWTGRAPGRCVSSAPCTSRAALGGRCRPTGGHDPLSFGPARDRGEELAADGAASRRARRDQRVARGPIALADACRHPHDDAHDATAALLDPV